MSICKPLPVIYVLTILLFLFVLAFPVKMAADSQLQNQKYQLEQQLRQIEEQITQYEGQLSQTKKQSKTLNNKIKELKISQEKIILQIKETSLKIKNTESNIHETELSISINYQAIQTLNVKIADIVRNIDFLQRRNPILYLLVLDRGLLGFFDELNSFNSLHNKLSSLVNEAEQKNFELKTQRENLVERREEQRNLIDIQNLQNISLLGNISNKSSLLKKTQGLEANYQALIKDKKKQAQEIRNRIYELFEANSTVNFGQAVEIAKFVSSQTGVRVAFLLAILTQESNLGKNVGTCNRAGDPPEKGWQVIMKPDRDQQPFFQITKELGLNPDITPVSCPMRDKSGKQIGWGGAMGPAQFIPSTWLGYKNQVSAVTGKLANPWDIRDAFIAAAIKLKAGGANSVAGEWKAAMLYFSGSTNDKFRFYADNVLNIASQYEEDINKL